MSWESKLISKIRLKKTKSFKFQSRYKIPEAAKSAQSIGIKTYHYNPDKKDLKSLKNFLTDNQ